MQDVCAAASRGAYAGRRGLRYLPDDPEPVALHKPVRGHLESFLEETHARSERGLTGYAEQDLRGSCGAASSLISWSGESRVDSTAMSAEKCRACLATMMWASYSNAAAGVPRRRPAREGLPLKG